MQYVIFKTSYTKQWRHSSFGNYYVHRLSDHLTFPLNVFPEKGVKPDTSYVGWSPVSHSVAFVQGNDLYVVPDTKLDVVDEKEGLPGAIRVTDDGGETVFNGVPDWVYEEEVGVCVYLVEWIYVANTRTSPPQVFQNNHALWWNPTGDTIAFLRSDETEVYDYTLQFYQHHSVPWGDYPYPENFVMKYPKPGTPNPLVTVYTFSLVQHFSTFSTLPALELLTWQGEMDVDKRVIIEVGWVGDYDLLVKETNRAATDGNVVLFRGKETNGRVVRKLGKDGEEGDDGWIEHVSERFFVFWSFDWPGLTRSYITRCRDTESKRHSGKGRI